MPRVNGDTFVSYAQNGEDVLLWRALGHVDDGRYVDVGAWDAVSDSVTKAFYDRGWRGVDVEPVPELADALRAARPGDEVVRAAVTASDDTELVLHRVVATGAEGDTTGLSTLLDDIAHEHAGEGFEVQEVVVPTTRLAAVCDAEVLGGTIHFLKIDVEGAEADALRSMDFERHRPWIVVVEATRPNSTEPSHEEWEGLLLAAGYEFAIFDGLSRYYVASERPELLPALSYPVCVFDRYTTYAAAQQAAELDALRAAHAETTAENGRLWTDLTHWRGVALDRWSQGFKERERLEKRLAAMKKRNVERAVTQRQELRDLRDRIDRIENSSSWRVTKPLRWARSKAPGQ